MGNSGESSKWELLPKQNSYLITTPRFRAQHLYEGERIVYRSSILTRAGIFLPKRRTLVLTSARRLLCVKEDTVKNRIKVESECVFATEILASIDEKRDPVPSQQGVLTSVIKKIYPKGTKAFQVQTVSLVAARTVRTILAKHRGAGTRRARKTTRLSRIGKIYAVDGSKSSTRPGGDPRTIGYVLPGPAWTWTRPSIPITQVVRHLKTSFVIIHTICGCVLPCVLRLDISRKTSTFASVLKATRLPINS
jgi:hypothetical protein